MSQIYHHPAFVLAALGVVSGVIGTRGLGVGIGEAPHLGAHMVLTGLWFGMVVAFGTWRWGDRSRVAVATAVIATWLGWEAAVNIAMQITENWLKAANLTEMSKGYVGGFFAGAIGAFVTWAGAATTTSAMRRGAVAFSVAATGALFGLLLPWTNQFDSPALLLIPWQTAVAAVLGFGLSARQPNPRVNGVAAL